MDFMNYQLTDDEFFRLISVKGHLGLMAGILTARKPDISSIDADDLFQFFNTQCEVISNVIRSTEERYKEQRGLEDITSFDLLMLVRMASGCTNISSDPNAMDTWMKIISMMKIDSGMDMMVNELKKIIESNQAQPKTVADKRVARASAAVTAGAR